jgi:salicylate hydroxylase
MDTLETYNTTSTTNINISKPLPKRLRTTLTKNNKKNDENISIKTITNNKIKKTTTSTTLTTTDTLTTETLTTDTLTSTIIKANQKIKMNSWIHYNYPVVIVGGGIAGLAAAIALQQNDIPVRIFERDIQFHGRRQGYGLTMQATKTLAELGILDACRAADTISDEHWTFHADGHILGYFGREFLSTDFDRLLHEQQQQQQGTNAKRKLPDNTGETEDEKSSRGNIRVPRETLRKMLLDQLLPDTITWNATLENFRLDDATNILELQFSQKLKTDDKDINITNVDTSTFTVQAAALVGADGIHSRVRQLMLRASLGKAASSLSPSITTLNYLGVVLVLGISSAEHFLIQKRGFYTLDGSQRLFTMPFATQPKKLTMWQLSFYCQDLTEARAFCSRGSDAVLASVIERTKTWHNPVPALLAGSIPSEVWATPLYDFGEDADHVSLPPGKPRGKNIQIQPLLSRVTLIGDAAHPMSPFKGQGANQALRDGPELAKALLRGGTGKALPGALRGFEIEMSLRAGAKVLASRQAAQFLHSKSILSAPPVIAGIPSEYCSAVLEKAASMGIKAPEGENLVKKFKECINNLIEEKKEERKLLSPVISNYTNTLNPPSSVTHTLLYYCYSDLSASNVRDDIAKWLETLPSSTKIVGRIRVAMDGLNATLGGTYEALVAHASDIAKHSRFSPPTIPSPIDFKYAKSYGARSNEAIIGCHFDNFEIKKCQELVTLGLPSGIAPVSFCGEHINAIEFHKQLTMYRQDNDVLIDCRNTYETDIGTFAGLPASMLFCPPTRTFSSFPAWVDSNHEKLRGRRVFMACTGGVRCERASAYVRHVVGNSSKVYQLEGGMYSYLGAAQEGKLTSDSLWKGKLFVFDERPAVAITTSKNDETNNLHLSTQEILGKCILCHTPFDNYKWLRCFICGVLVLVCDECVCKNGGYDQISTYLFCKDCKCATTINKKM